MTARLLDDTVYGSQPETRSLSLRFRREERLENVRHRLGIDPTTRVGHGELYEPTGPKRSQPSPFLAGQDDVCCFQCQSAAVGHRITGIHRKVHYDLLDLGGIDQCVADQRVQLGDHFDLLADETREHVLHSPDDCVQVH